MTPKTRTGILFTLMMVFGYSFLPIFTKLVYQYSDNIRGIDIAAWRFIFVVPLLWAFVYWRTRLPTADRSPLPRKKLLFLGMLLAVGAVSAFYGLAYIDASIYSVLFRTQPIMVIVINALLGERFPLRGWIALSVVTTGVVLVLDPGNVSGLAANLTHATVLGIAIALLNAFSIALYNVGQQYFMTGHSAKIRAAAWTVTGTLLTITPVVLLMGLRLPPNWQTTATLLGLAVICTFIPVVALYEAIERLGASRMVIFASIEPLVTITMAVILLGEKLLTPVQMIGAVFVLSSLFILQGKVPRFLRGERTIQHAPTGD